MCFYLHVYISCRSSLPSHALINCNMFQLYKSAGEDVIQLFDLCDPPKSNSTNEHRINCDSLSSLIQKGRKDSLFSLGTLLYRVAHRLSLSKVK